MKSFESLIFSSLFEEHSRDYYHVTRREFEAPIMKNGLEPRIGRNSESASESRPGVWLFNNKDSMEESISDSSGWLKNAYGDSPISIILVKVPHHVSLESDARNPNHSIARNKISPEHLQVVERR